MLNKMNLQWRLISSFSFVGTIVFFVGLVGWNSSWKLSNHIETLDKNNIPGIASTWGVNEAHTRITGLQKFLRNVDMTQEERQSILQEIETSVRRLEEEYKNYQATPINNEEEANLRKELEVLLNQWRTTYNQYMELEAKYNRLGYQNPWKREVELLSQGQANSPEMEKIKQAKIVRDQLIAYTNNELNSRFKEVDEVLFKIIENNEKFAIYVRKLAEQDVLTSNILITTGVILGPILSILFGIMIARQISNPVNRVVDIAEQISTGNLTAEIEVRSEHKDEIGQLMVSFYTMIQKLNNLIFQVQSSATKVSLSTTKIAASGKQLEASITEQLASTNQVTAATKEISSTSKQLVKTVEEVTAMSKNTTMAASDSQKYLQQMEATMKQLLEATNSIAGRLGVISEKANNINNIVVAITKVADQTNLLSFNAAIEAEKAGEYGLGFAVVAREIRRLADQTAVATVDIEQMVKQMQSSVSTGVMEMDKFAAEVSRSVENVGEISSNLGQIIEEVQELTPRFELVNQGMESQSQGAQQISEAMSQLSQNSRQTAATLQEINHAITLLNEVNQGLNQEIRRFKLSAVVEKSIEESQVLFQR